MKKNLKRFFSMMLALSMVFSLVVPAAATETAAHDHAEHAAEAKQEESINMEAVLENITVNTEDVDLELDLTNKIVLADPNTEVDMEDPAILAFETDLKAIKVWDEAAQQPVPLTEEQIQQVLGLYQQYLDHWDKNADTLGLQVPFFLDYNDEGEDGLGVLGEMLALANVPVDAVRAGAMTMDDLTGMILNFYYGDQLGVAYYGAKIEAARDEVMQLIKESGAQTEAQKLLVINDWLAHNNTFDMPYIMNSGKEENEKPMVAENPVKHEHYDDVLGVMTEVYTGILTDTFETQIRDGLEAEFKKQYYTEAIKNIIYQGGLAEARQNPELIEALKAELGWDEFYEAEEKKVYDEAYAEYMLQNHEHELTVTFDWEEVKAEDGTTVIGWTCAEEAEVTCSVEGCTAELTAAVELEKDETTNAATCTEDGKVIYTATATVTTTDAEGETVTVGEPVVETKEVAVEALGHEFDENGECTRCDAKEEPDHVHEAVVTITWNDDNTATATVACSEGCDGLTVSTPVVTSETTKAATCGEAGVTTYTAAVTVTDSKGNTVQGVIVEKETTTTEIPATGEHVDNRKDNVCDVCGQDIPVVDEHTHTYEWVETTPATCTAPGVESFKCTDEECGDISETRAIDALGHDMDEGTVTTAATCTEAGVKTKNCERQGCTHTETEPVAKLGHDLGEYAVVKEDDKQATCEEAGKLTASCSRCTYAESKTFDALGHHYVDGVCDREGCGATEPVTCEHEWVFDDHTGLCRKCQAMHPNHTKNVYNDFECEVCGLAIEKWETEASSGSDIPEFFTSFTKDVATVAEEGDTTGDDTTDGEETDPEVDPDADAYAKGVVEEKKAEIEAAANEASGLNAAIEQTVTGGTEDVDTDIENEIWAEAEAFVAQEEVAAALAEDPAGFVDSQEMFQQQVPVTDAEGNYVIGEDGNPVMMTLADQLHLGWDQFWKDAQETGLEIDPVNAPGYKMTVDQIVAQQMDTPMADLPEKVDENGNPVLDEEGNPVHMTPNEAVPVFAAQAAAGLTDGIINYWEGSHFGALGFGTSVCLGYTKAFTYLVQCLHPEIYLKDGATDPSNAANWKTRDEVYVYDENGKIDINQNYVVDAVRVTFDASVTMYGETEDNFNSDHFWNAVKIDGKWYYADPCYTDVFTEVMMRDRVETDGQMNHLYFVFSHTAAVNMYEGNYKEIKTMYDTVATDTTYEDSWISRIKSNTYFADGYAYYMYDSTDMLTMMEEYENQNTEADIEDPVYKIVRHKLDADDSGNGDKDYETLIVFNYTKNDDDEAVATVYDPAVGATVDNELLTQLWKKHAAYAETYPSIMINAAYYNGKMYFNLANCILSYDVASGAVAMVKEYNTVQGKRDTTKPFGGMAFSVVSDGGDFTVENHPIAGMTIKDDGNMYVSVATNFAFISGKADRANPASEGFGYAYEESNYNSNYNSYMDFGDYDDDQLADFGYTREVNDNDEFMWTANFVEKLSMSHLNGSSHSYAAVSVDAACGIDAYTENRCTSCGMIEADSRVYEEGTAIEHHFVEFEETFYTKDDAGRWNGGICYVCTECGYAVTEPKKPTGQMAEQEGAMEEYEEAKAIFDAAKASAGHAYVPTDATWAEDNSTVTFTTLECSAVCPERKPYLDCLLNDNTITITLEEATTFDVTEIETTGICPEGVTKIYTVIAEVEIDGAKYPFTVTKTVELEPTNCTYVDGICSVCGNCAVKRVYGTGRVETALEVADALKEALNVEKFDAIILANGENNSFADALTGSYLANKKGAPILLYRTSGMSELNLEYIASNLSSNGTIYLLGGVGVIPASVEEALSSYTVKRLAGTTRFDTNLAILKEAGVTDEEILIARGFDFADSLSASASGLPILVVNEVTSKLTDAQIEYLKQLDGNKMTIIGGPAIIKTELEEQIEEIIDAQVDRLYGDLREDTSVMIAEEYIDTPDFAVVAYSRTSPDGLCGGPLAYAKGAPLLLTNVGHESKAAKYVAEEEIAAGYILGGEAIVSDETAREIFGLSENAVINKK